MRVLPAARKRGLRDPELATDLFDGGAEIGLVQCERNLLLGELTLLHGEL